MCHSMIEIVDEDAARTGYLIMNYTLWPYDF